MRELLITEQEGACVSPNLCLEDSLSHNPTEKESVGDKIGLRILTGNHNRLLTGFLGRMEDSNCIQIG